MATASELVNAVTVYQLVPSKYGTDFVVILIVIMIKAVSQ
jgi:hypothetical protein